MVIEKIIHIKIGDCSASLIDMICEDKNIQRKTALTSASVLRCVSCVVSNTVKDLALR